MRDGDTNGLGGTDPLERLVAAIEGLAQTAADDLRERSKPPSWWQSNGTAAAVFVSAAALCVTVFFSQRQLSDSSEQFEQTLRQNQYADIVNGMASSSVGVQVNSIRRLRQYVADPDNFPDDRSGPKEAAEDAAQTFAAFIEDESTIPNHEGLSDYRDPYPVVVSRAMDQLIELTTPPGDAGTRYFPEVAIDVSRGNFHGIPAAGFAPQGPFLAVGADFRAATVTGWNLTAVESPTLTSAFFTCANLQKSDLGTADVAATDFTGANLRGANLSGVRNLTQEQLRGALVGDKTKLPQDIEPRSRGWGIDTHGETFRPSPRCRHLMDRMTNLLAGAGYSSRIPCPSDQRLRWTIRLSQAQQSALERTCRLREAPPGSRGPS